MEELHPDTPIYRIIDYFEFSNMIRKKTLRFSRASTFSDNNEGVHRIFTLSKSSGGGWKSNEDIVEYHNHWRNNYFASCWTLAKESIAMWSLYSTDNTSIRIKTTVGKLQSALDIYFTSTGIRDIYKCKPGVTFSTVSHVELDRIRYIDYQDRYKSIIKHRKVVSRLIRKREKNNTKVEFDPKNPPKIKKRKYDDLPLNPFLIKDEAYKHEQELRGLILVGHVNVDSGTLREFKALPKTNENAHNYLGYAHNWAPKEAFPDYIFIPTQSDFIDEACIDPRCQQHKVDYIESEIKKLGIKTIKSTVFGYVFDDHDFLKL